MRYLCTLFFVSWKLLEDISGALFSPIYLNDSNTAEYYIPLLAKILEAPDFPIHCPIILGYTELTSMKPLFLLPSTYPYRPWMFMSPSTLEGTPLLIPEENVTVTYGYPWNYNPLVKDIGNCALFVLNFQDKYGLEKIVRLILTILKVNWDRYYFFLIGANPVRQNEEDPADILLNSTVTSVMKYKTLPVRNQNRSQMFTACFYCDGGYPMVLSSDLLPTGDGGTSMKFIYPDFTKDMNNTHLTGVYLEESSKKETQRIMQTKETFLLIHTYFFEISEALSFNYSIYRIDTGVSGAFNKRLDDGMWVGLAGDVLYEKADFAHAVIPTHELMPFLNIATELTTTRFIIIGSKPKIFFSPWILLKAFGIGLWSAIVVSVSVTSLVFGYTLEKEKKLSFLGRYFYAFYFILLSAIGCPFSLPIRTASRILLTFWLLSCIIISFSYQSNLTSIMTIPSKEDTPSTYEEILEMNYKYGGSSLVNAFFQFLTSESEITYISEIRDNIINFDTIKECFEASLETKLVCITVPEVGMGDVYNFLDENYHLQLDPKFQSGITTLGSNIFRKDFVGFESFNRAVRSCKEAGIFQFWDREESNRNFWDGLRKKRINKENVERNEVTSNTKSNQLSFKQLSAPFIVLVFGFGFAILVFVFEASSKFTK